MSQDGTEPSSCGLGPGPSGTQRVVPPSSTLRSGRAGTGPQKRTPRLSACDRVTVPRARQSWVTNSRTFP